MRMSYLNTDIGALERIDIICELRSNQFVGVYLLRESVDIPTLLSEFIIVINIH